MSGTIQQYYSTPVGGGPFPTGLEVWIKRDTGLWQDAAKTIAAGTGDDVYTWEDQSGNGNDFIQDVAGKRPTANATGVNFTGSETMKISSITLPSHFTVVFVWDYSSGTGFFMEHSANANTNDGFYLHGGTGHTAQIKRVIAARTLNAASWQVGDVAVKSFAYGPNYPQGVGYGTLRNNGAEVLGITQNGTGLADTEVTDQLNLCSRNQTSVFSNGELRELLIYSDDLSLADLQTTENYLNSVYTIY